jgi:hypothetical protein
MHRAMDIRVISPLNLGMDRPVAAVVFPKSSNQRFLIWRTCRITANSGGQRGR